MKNLLVLASLLFATSAMAGFVTGDKIHFQSESTYVSAVFNKTLCFDGESFHATFTKCIEWQRDQDDRNCIKYGKITATQPQSSTRLRCAEYRGNDGDCKRWERVSYEQSEVRNVKYFNNDDDLIKEEKVIIPVCM